MEAMTPEWQEIMRLWSVIQRLTQRKEAKMTDREEAVFGEVYQEFKRTTGPVLPKHSSLETTLFRAELARSAAACMRMMYDMEKQ